MTPDELLKEIQCRILRHAQDGPFREVDLRELSNDEVQAFMLENPGADYYTPGYCEVPISARVPVLDELGNPAAISEYFVVVDRISRHYGGPEEGGWWYDSSEPVDHRLILIEFSPDGPCIRSESEEVLRLASIQWSEGYDFSCSRWSMAPRGSDFGIRVGAGDIVGWDNYTPYC